MKHILPGYYRTCKFYYHLVPIFLGYFRTFLSGSINKKLTGEQIQCIWNKRHLWGAQRSAIMVKELSGFYIKVSQVFATKPDLLPKQYVDSLKFVFEDCRETQYRKVQKLLKYQLGITLQTTFTEFTKRPIASATIAQVHLAQLRESNEKVAVKIQHPGSSDLMLSDIKNMLHVSIFMDTVPKEFDFIRENDMLNSIGNYISRVDCNIEIPRSQPCLCSRKVLTMGFIVGDRCDTIFAAAEPILDQQEISSEFCRSLFSSYGYQLFGIGIFHSDPHPGNVFLTKSGACALLDFGQMKVLRDETQLLFARMIIALKGDSAECVKLMKQIGLKLDKTTTDIEMIIAYLLFDTRMDIREAKISPLSSELPQELRVVSLSEIDSDIFMIIRIVSMFRGILTSQGVDVHARSIWYSFALAVLYRNGEYYFHSSHVDLSQKANVLREQMKDLSKWMRSHDLPHNRDALLPFAVAGIFTTSELRRVILSEKTCNLPAIFRNFSESDMERCLLVVGNM